MPALGYGVGTAWFKADEVKAEALKSSIKTALNHGFRHLDDAEMYMNCEITGAAVKEWLEDGNDEDGCKRCRSQLFITQKVDDIDVRPITETCDILLQKMGLEYFDLFLIHAPMNRHTKKPFEKPLQGAWKEMQQLVVNGKVRAVGVSNFRIKDLEEVLVVCENYTPNNEPIATNIDDINPFLRPVCNQVEFHPFLQQQNLYDFCKKQNITITAYAPQCPITRAGEKGRFFTNDNGVVPGATVHGFVKRAARRLNKTEGQILLRWCYQSGRIPITTSSNEGRMLEYLGIFGENAVSNCQLNEEEMEGISNNGQKAKHERVFWTQVEAMYGPDPALEVESAC